MIYLHTTSRLFFFHLHLAINYIFLLKFIYIMSTIIFVYKYDMLVFTFKYLLHYVMSYDNDDEDVRNLLFKFCIKICFEFAETLNYILID